VISVRTHKKLENDWTDFHEIRYGYARGQYSKLDFLFPTLASTDVTGAQSREVEQ
jgi:hypothetical protein